MGGKSSTLSWLTVPLRWTSVSAAVLLEARRVPPAALFSHEAAGGGGGGGGAGALLGTASDALVARCTGLLFGPRAIALPTPDSAGGYSSVLSQLLQASCAELDGIVQSIVDTAERHNSAAAVPPAHPAAAAAAAATEERAHLCRESAGSPAPFACLADAELPVPARNYRILVLHLVRLTEQYCTIDTTTDETLAASILMSSSVCQRDTFFFPLAWAFSLLRVWTGKERASLWDQAAGRVRVVLP